MNKENEEILSLAKNILQKENTKKLIKDTYGLIILKDGTHVRLYDDFELVAELWKLYNLSITLNDKSIIKTILTETTQGGIVDIGLTIIDIREISTMYPIYRFFVDDEERQLNNIYKARNIERFMYDLTERDD